MSCTCGYTNPKLWEPGEWHKERCPMSEHPDGMKAVIAATKRTAEHYERVMHRWIASSRLWEGKFHAVKRENNALRRKLYPNK